MREMPWLLAELRKRVLEIDVRAAPTAHPPALEVSPRDRYEFDDAATFREAKERVVSRWERWYLSELLRRHGGNLSKAARAARMDRSYLRDLVMRYQDVIGAGATQNVRLRT